MKVPVYKDSALFLFGGVEKILGRLTLIVQDRIKNYSDSDLDNIEHHLRLEKSTLGQIVKGHKSADKNIFLALKAPLKLTVCEVLGEPERLNDPQARAHWEKEHKEKPMRVVSCCGGQGGASIPKNPIDLRLYVTLRAIGEFYRL